MLLSEARTRTRFYLNEATAAQWADARLNELLVSANYEVFCFLVSRAHDLFIRDVRCTYTADALNITLDTTSEATAGTIGRWLKVLDIFQLETNAAMSRTNPPYQMEQVSSLYNLYRSVRDTRNFGQTSSPGLGSFRFCLVGRKLYLEPVPEAAVFLWLHLVPLVFAPTSDLHHMLSVDAGVTAEFDEHVELIPMLAAIKAKIQVDDTTNVLQLLYAAKKRGTEDVVAALQSIMLPRKGTAAHH